MVELARCAGRSFCLSTGSQGSSQCIKMWIRVSEGRNGPPKTSGNKSKRNRPPGKGSLFRTKTDVAKSHSKSIL